MLDPPPPIPPGWTPMEFLQWLWGFVQELTNDLRPRSGRFLSYVAWITDVSI